MARPLSESLTDREAQLMEVLWVQGPCTAEAVRLAFPTNPTTPPCERFYASWKRKAMSALAGDSR